MDTPGSWILCLNLVSLPLETSTGKAGPTSLRRRKFVNFQGSMLSESRKIMLLTKICKRGAAIEGKMMINLFGGMVSSRYLRNIQTEVQVGPESVTR